MPESWIWLLGIGLVLVLIGIAVWSGVNATAHMNTTNMKGRVPIGIFLCVIGLFVAGTGLLRISAPADNTASNTQATSTSMTLAPSGSNPSTNASASAETSVLGISSSAPSPTTTQTSPEGSPSTSTEPATVAQYQETIPESTVELNGVITARGKVSNLQSSQTIWLLDYDGQTYTSDGRAAIVGEDWSASSEGPFGDDGQPLPFGFTLVLVVASPDCDTYLQAKLDANDSTFTILPDGECTSTDSKNFTVVKDN